MILRCNYEELIALRSGANAFLEGGVEDACVVAAPTASRAKVEALVPRLTGDFTVETLADQSSLETALDMVVECLRVEMETSVVTAHPAHEAAVAAYFEFAHALAVLERVREVGREMEALIEVMTGSEPTPELARTFQFPD